MDWIDTEADLAALYGAPGIAATRKVVPIVTPLYRQWITASRFCVLATVGPEGVDASPRGDDGPVATVIDPHHLAIPDWRGNNRLDSLRNIVRDPRVAVMFLVPGSTEAVRVNGRARITQDPDLCAQFARQGQQPTTVMVVQVAEVYAQCSRAIMRAAIWSRDDAAGLPSLGAFLTEATAGEFDGAEFDQSWPARARGALW